MWSLFLTSAAEADFKKLDKTSYQRILSRLEWFQDNFDNITPLPLGGEWRDYFKLRIGDLRIIYKIQWEKNTIIVYAIGRRDKIYKKKSK